MRGNCDYRTQYINIPGQEVEPGEGHIFCPDQNGQEEVSENGGQSGDHNQEDHGDPVKGEESIIGLGFHDRLTRSDQLKLHQQSEYSPNSEKGHDQVHVHETYPLVIGRQEPC